MANKDKIAIITGSSSGLGAAVAIDLAKKGIKTQDHHAISDKI